MVGKPSLIYIHHTHLLGAYPIGLQSTASISHIVVATERQQFASALSPGKGEQAVSNNSFWVVQIGVFCKRQCQSIISFKVKQTLKG